MLKTISPNEAEIGMYVHGFRGSWLSHPFWRSKFEILSQEVLVRVREGPAAIVIDTAKGKDVAATSVADGVIPPARRTGGPVRPASVIAPSSLPMSLGARQPPAPARIVAPAKFGRADRARAVALAQRSTTVVKALFQDFRLGHAVSTPAILAVVNDISSTLNWNSAAFVNVIRLKSKDDDTFTHSVAVCALMINLAREADASPDMVRAMGMAGLLHDIGKVSIDGAILRKAGALTEDEHAEMRRHPQLGHAMLAEGGDLPVVALDVCLHHHERLDGSGYPFGYSGEQISQAARIAAICDVYDAMTSERPYRKGMAPAEAMTAMEATAGLFDPQLLFRFMRSMSVFPAGKLVRLRSNRLAVVLPSRHEERKPLARAFYSTSDTCFIPYEDVILGNGLAGEEAMSAEEPDRWFSTDWSAMARRIVERSPAQPPADAAV